MGDEYLRLSKWFEGLLMNVSPRHKGAEAHHAGHRSEFNSVLHIYMDTGIGDEHPTLL